MVNKKIDELKAFYDNLGVVDLSLKTNGNVGDYVSTGFKEFDNIIGGIPFGRALEIFGTEGAGKTGLVMYIAAAFQRAGARIHWVDAEQQFEPQFAKNAGLKISQKEGFYFSQENILDIIMNSIYNISGKLSEMKQKSLWVIDTIASCPTEAEMQKAAGERTVASQANMMSVEMRKLIKFLRQTKTTVIFINQIREAVGVRFGDPEKTPVGRALKFYATQRVRVRIGKKIKRGERTMGHNLKIKTIKNRIVPPFQECSLPLLYNIGIEPDYEIIDAIVKQKGSGVTYKNGEFISEGKKMNYQQLKRFLKVKKLI